MGQQEAPLTSDAALLKRQATNAVRALLRPSTHLGNARELALLGVHLATYPLGLVPALRRRAAERTWAVPEWSLLATDPETACMPVVLVHGYFHNRSAFLVLTRALRRAGIRHVHGLNYNPLTAGVPELAGRLRVEVERALEASGNARCQLVGHSLGGMVARWYTQELGGWDTVDTVITLGSPHRGTYTAYVGAGPVAAELRPGSWLVRRLSESARPSETRWVSFYSDLDLLVAPAVSAKLTHPALAARNVKVRDTGHLSLLLSARVVGAVVDHLLDRGLGRLRRDEPAGPDTADQARMSGA
jgi:triacylglycerol lipase